MPPSNTPVDEKSVPIETKSLSREEEIDFLGSDDDNETIELEKDSKAGKKDDEKPGKGDKDDKDDKDEKDDETKDELKEIEEELELEDKPEDELELVVPARKKEILAKYPSLFKDFPYLEKAYYREQKYAEILPTIADAEAAIERSNTLTEIETKLSEGSTTDLLKSVKANDEEAFYRIVDNYLPSLEAVDSNAYFHIIGNIIKHTIASMVGEKDDDLTDAARLLNKYVFGSEKYERPARLSKVETPQTKNEKDSVVEERKKFNEERFESVKGDLNTKLDNILKSTIDKNIDPKESMPPYVKKYATKEAQEHLDTMISQDTRFLALLDKLWMRVLETKFSPDSVDRIKSAYLAKAKTLLPSAIKKARADALKGLGKRVADDNDETDKKGPIPVGKIRTSASSSNSGQKTERDKAKEIPRGMSNLDYLLQD